MNLWRGQQPPGYWGGGSDLTWENAPQCALEGLHALSAVSFVRVLVGEGSLPPWRQVPCSVHRLGPQRAPGPDGVERGLDADRWSVTEFATLHWDIGGFIPCQGKRGATLGGWVSVFGSSAQPFI